MPVKSLKGGIGVRPLGFGLGAAREEVDPNFNSNILLIHADGSEGEGNTPNLGDPSYKAFQDNSTSAHAIVVNGDAYGNDFSPYYYGDGYWSNSFDGTDDVLNIADDASLDFGTGDWTVECRFNQTKALSDYQTLWSKYASNVGYYIFTTSAGKILLGISNVSSTTSTATFSLNTWHHLAVTKYSGVLYVWLDGVQIATLTSASSLDNSTPFLIGNINGFSRFFGGYISNFRIVKGTALYTSGFTPSTSPFTTTSQSATASEVELLTCQSNRFVDNSSEEHSITLTSSPKVSTNTPFTQSKTANVGSGFFDGSGDYLEALDNGDLDLGTGNFTIEAWLYLDSAPHDYQMIVSSDGGNQYVTLRANSVAVRITSEHNLSYGTTPTPNEWFHLAVVRSGSTVTVYIDGVSIGTATDSGDFNLNSGGTFIGAYQGPTHYFDGYIADLRIVNGTAVYTSTFTPPTTTLASTGSETKLLTCQYSGAVRNEGFLDDGKYNSRVVPTSNVTLGTFSPFSGAEGYWSVFFDGDDDELNLTNTATIGTGNFTIEMWVFPHNRSNSCLIDSRSSNGATDGIIFKLNGSKFQISGTNGTTDIPLNEWTHLAVVREGTGTNETKMYVNGALDKTITFNLNLTSTFFGVGVFNDGGNSGDYKGYISNLRVVNDTVYTDTFTVPSTPLTAISNTDVLICQSNRFVDNSTNGFAITLPQGTAKILPFSPFAPTRSYTKDVVGGSFYNPASSQYLEIQPQQTDHFYFYGDFTLEGWLYSLNASDTSIFIGTGGSYFALNVNPHDNVTFYANSSSPTVTFNNTSSIFKQGEWKHIALVRSSSTIKLYVNGIADSTTGSNSSALGYSGQKMRLGSTVTQEYFFAFPRISNSARYTSNFTPQTTPWTSSDLDANALFASNFTNAGIIDRTAKNVLRTIGNTRTTTTDKKFGTGSLVFDGNDYLEAVATENRELFTPETGDMTWEMFVKFDILDGDHALFSKYGSGSEYQFYYSNGSNEWRLSYHATTNAWSDSSISTGTWYHIALVKDGTTVYLFKDGTSLGTNTMTYNTSQTGRNFVLGVSFNGSNSALYQLKGKLDEVRVTRLARYTSNFTAPTKAFPNK